MVERTGGAFIPPLLAGKGRGKPIAAGGGLL